MVKICPHCGKVLHEGMEYCDGCGGVLNIDDEIQEYEISYLPMEYYKIKSTVTKKDLLLQDNEYIKNPDYIDEEDKTIYFHKGLCESTLYEFVEDKSLTASDMEKIAARIIEIFKVLEEKELIISAINLEDFWIENEDINSIKLWVRRSFIVNKKIKNNFDYGYSVISPEIENKGYDKIDLSSNVYLFGKLLLQIFLSDYEILSDDEEMYFGYNLALFFPELKYEFHNFILKCCNTSKEKRFKSMEEVSVAFRYIIKKKSVEKDNLRLKAKGLSDVGVNKLKYALKKRNILQCDDENQFNEDMFLIRRAEDRHLLVLGDGVSTATYGSGKEASGILKKNIVDLWNERNKVIKEKQDVYDFIKEIIKRSNKDIVESVKDKVNIEEDGVKGIMASTLIVAIILKNKMYYTSIGDSKIFIYSDKSKMNLLNYEDNIMNENLKQKKSWRKIFNSKGCYAITRYIGGAKIVNGELQPRNLDINLEEVMLQINDIIMICSDGVTDYINPPYFSKGLWGITETLEEIIEENKDKSLDDINKIIIDRANKNGGGDNITVITARVFK